MDHSMMLKQETLARSWTSAWLAVLFIAASGSTAAWAQQAQSPATTHYEVTQSVQRLEMLVKSSRILTTAGQIPKFQVHNEDVVSAIPIAENEIQLFAKAPGTTQINIWDHEDQYYTVDVTIVSDARMIEGILSSQLPLANLRVTPLADSAVISGTVTSIEDVDLAVAIAEQFYPSVINNIKVVGVQQVLLHTKIMEVSRTKLRDLGIDWNFEGNALSFVGASGKLEGTSVTTNLVSSGFTSLLAAMRRDNLVKLLAEPTVVATHGRPARFNVGGKVPYIVYSGFGSVTIQYEEYGTSVDFVPFVLGPGRLRLEVRPEVSEPDESRAVTVNGSSVTAFTNRYVETAIEMQAGQTFAIAGLLQSRTESTVQKVPLLGELPYMGSFFRRVRDRRNDVELLIMVTPEFVDAMDPHEVPCGGPGLSTTNPSDKELYLKGYIEVPNLYGDCGCGPAGGEPCPGGNCGPLDDFGLMGEVLMVPGQSSPVNPGQAPHHEDERIFLEASPTVVGEGVTVMAPTP